MVIFCCSSHIMCYASLCIGLLEGLDYEISASLLIFHPVAFWPYMSHATYRFIKHH